MLEELLEIEGNRVQQYRFVGTAAPSRVHAAQPIVLEQAPKYRFNGALLQVAHPSSWPALLLGQRPAVVRIVRRAGNLTALTLRDTGWFTQAGSTIAGGGTVAFGESTVLVGIKAFKRQRLARWAGKVIRCLVIGKALDFGLIMAEDGNLGGGLGLGQGIFQPVRVVDVRANVYYR